MSPSGDWTGGRRLPWGTGWFSKRNRSSRMSRARRGDERAKRFDEFTDIGRPGRRLTQTLSDRAGALAIAAEQPEPPASPGLVKRLFEWVRERVQKMLHRLRPSRASASSGSFRGRWCRTGTGRRGRAGTARAAPGPQADHGRPGGRPEVGRHPAGHRHPHLCRRVDQRPAGDVGGSPSGPRTDRGRQRHVRLSRPRLPD